jgi:hypothetical protein
MSDNEENKDRKEQKPVWVQNYIKRLQAEGFVRWDSCTWIHPKDIPLFVAKGKINRARRRRALVLAQRAKAKTNPE